MSCFLESDGTVRCFFVAIGALAQGGSPPDAPPDFRVALGASPDRIGIAAHGNRVCAFGPEATQCPAAWPRDTDETPRPPPGARKLVLGRRHGCFLTDAGGVHCWGDNDVGQLGTGEPPDADREETAPVPGLEDIVEIGARDDHTCALDRAGRAFCWGDNMMGVAGLEPQCHVPTPTRLEGAPPVSPR